MRHADEQFEVTNGDPAGFAFLKQLFTSFRLTTFRGGLKPTRGRVREYVLRRSDGPSARHWHGKPQKGVAGVVRRIRTNLGGRKPASYIVSMTIAVQLETISDDELLRSLSELLRQSRRVESELVAHIGEVDQRRLYAREAVSSMFKYCTEVLHLSEFEAYLRIAVARAARRHPLLLTMLADGRLHLSGIAKLAPHLTEANRETLLGRAAHQSKHRIEELVAVVAPRPDVATTLRKLPAPRRSTAPLQLGPDRVVPPASRPLADGVDAPVSSIRRPSERGGVTVQTDRPQEPAPSALAPAPARPTVIEPLAPARYKVAFTASAAFHDKLRRLRALMHSSVPDGDLAVIIEKAVTEKLERLEAKRFGKTNAPRKSLEQTDTSPSSRYIPAPVRRAVHKRDGGRCCFVDEQGRRCTERERLEFHHKGAFGRGGDHSVDNLELSCRPHNAYLAERDYGKEVMARYRRTASRVSRPVAVSPMGAQKSGSDLVAPHQGRL